MGFVFSLAVKNLLRYKRRTLITAVAIAAGLAIYIWVDAFMLGVESESERNLLHYETGSGQVLTEAYFADLESLPLDSPITDPEGVLTFLAGKGIHATKRITFAGELFFFPGEAGEIDRSRNIKCYALDPATIDRVFKINEVITEDHRFPDAGAMEILLGQELAVNMQIAVGDQVQVRTRSRYGNEVVIELQVAGLINCPNPVVNKGTAFLPLLAADEYLDMEGAVTDIPVLFPEWKDSKKEVAALDKLIQASFPGLTARDWDDLSGNIMYAQNKKKGIIVLLLLVAVIAAVGITNTMLMAVYERIREIGMMRAMGMFDKDIARLFLIEAGGIGLIGSAIGTLLGVLLTYISIRWGFDVSAFFGDMDLGYRVYGVFRAAWNPPTIVLSFIFGVIASVLVANYPASRALKIEITDCLRHQ